MQIQSGIHQQHYPVGPGVKLAGRKTYIHQRHNPKMKDQPILTADSLLNAAVVNDSCVFTVGKYNLRYRNTLK
jgi:hypothetical protein